MQYGLVFVIITEKKNVKKRRKCWKPVSFFPATFFQAFFCMIIKTQNYSHLTRTDL